MNYIQPYLCPPPLVDINKELKPTGLNSSCHIREIVIITNSSVNDMETGIQPYIYHPPVGIDKELIFLKFNSPSGIRATMTSSNVSAPSQPFPFFANVNKDLTCLGNINTLFIYFRVENRLIQ